jgi:hypothetical protein
MVVLVAAGCMSSPTCGLVPHENLTHGRIRRRMRWLLPASRTAGLDPSADSPCAPHQTPRI